MSIKRSIVLLHGVLQEGLFDRLRKDKVKAIYVLEGRPSLKAARYNCRELLKRKLKPTLIADNMAGFLFNRGMVAQVWLSYYLSDKNGAVCPIGSLILAVLAKRHKVAINLFPAEGRIKFLGSPNEILLFNDSRVASDNIKGYVPLVEWVDKKYIGKIHE